MAHKIDFSKGRAAYVGYQKPAWHNLGTTQVELLTLEDCLNHGGLDFHVVKAPNHHLINGIYHQSDTSFFTYRTDVNTVLGSKLGSDYTVFQNRDALAIVDDLLKSGKVIIETAASLDEGKKVFICMRIKDTITVGSNDVIEQYVLIVLSHDGTMSIIAMPTNVRVVCNNTMSVAVAGAKREHKIRHTANAAARVKEAFTILGLLEGNQKVVEEAYNAMRCNVLSKAEFFDYIGNVFMTPEEIAELQKGNKEVLSTRKKHIIENVLEYAETGVGQREALGTNGELNSWFAYNAVTGFLSSKDYKNETDRFNSLLMGNSAEKIKTASDLALFPQNIKSLKQSNTYSLN